MQRYPETTTPESPALSIARSLIAHNERTFKERVAEHRARFREVWESPVPPAEIIAQLGTSAVRYLFDASESVEHITKLVCGPAIVGMTPEQIQAALHEVLPPEQYAPRLPLTPNPDGTITVGTVDGLDEWGRVIPEPEEQA
jgi:hypothetical protein